MSDVVQEGLLSEFSASSYEQWREAAEALLKGAPFDKVMRTKTLEDIVLEPIYRREDCSGLQHGEAIPGQGDFLRGAHPQGYLLNGWEIAQDIGQGSPEAFNKVLLNALENGQSALRIRLDRATRLGLDPDEAESGQVSRDGLSLVCLEDFRNAFAGVATEAVPLYFESGCSGLFVRSLFAAWLAESKMDGAAARGGLGMDPLGELASDGSLPGPLASVLDEAAVAARRNGAEMPGFATFMASGWPYHRAGASSTQELACALATGVYYLRAMASRGVGVDVAAHQIQMDLAIGPDFFMEIAKLRAARQLWSRVVRALGGSTESAKLKLHARTGIFNKTKYDPYVNMLRGTTEALSAVIGGADSVTVGRFDEVLRPSSEFSSRIARNVQLILQEECELTSVIDPAGGSWYVERLTDQFARESWKQFQAIEKQGGLLEALRSGYVDESIGKTRYSKETMLGQRRIKLVGTNQYPNLEEPSLASPESITSDERGHRVETVLSRRPKDAEIATPDVWSDRAAQGLVGHARRGATLGQMVKATRRRGAAESCKPLPDTRIAVIYEELRAASAAYRKSKGRGPLLFLANLGPLRRHKARADFTRSFFETGGFEVVGTPGFDDATAAAAAFKESGARLVVICGADPDYVERVPELARALKQANPEATVVLAGHPGESEAIYREAGMDDYIFVKSDNYEVNRKYLAELGAL